MRFINKSNYSWPQYVFTKLPTTLTGMLRILSMLSLQQWLYLSRDGSTRSAAWELGVPSRIWGTTQLGLRSKACQKLAKGSTNRYHEKRPCVAFFIFLNRPKAQRCCKLIYIHIPKCVYILSPHDLQHQKCSSWTQRCFTQPKKRKKSDFGSMKCIQIQEKKNRKLTKSSKSSVKTGQQHWSLEIPSPPDTLAAVLSCLDQAWHSCSTALGPAATAASLNGGLNGMNGMGWLFRR